MRNSGAAERPVASQDGLGSMELKRVGRDFKERGRGHIEVLSWNLAGRTEENHESQVRIASVLAEIRTEYLPNTSLERYSHTNKVNLQTVIFCVRTPYTPSLMFTNVSEKLSASFFRTEVNLSLKTADGILL
jgi:hypothetical protein